MSITGALNNALSGLRVSSRASELVASNLANSMTPGYGRRTLSVSSAIIGDQGGVRINGTVRHTDPAVLADRRFASAEYGNQSQTAQFLARFENLIGTPDADNSISGRLAAFEASLISAASRPDAPERLDAAAISASELAKALNTASKGVQDSRSQADRNIATQVTLLNESLLQVQELNSQITAAMAQGNEDAALRDHRQLVIDQIAEIVPVSVLPRDNGAVALYSIGGSVLLDGKAAEVGFQPSNVVTAYMNIEDGNLSGLTLNGNVLRTTPDTGQLRGGTLAAQFEIRDELGTHAQSQLDAVARDLIARFEGVAADPTRFVGAPGVLTENGAAFTLGDEVGLSARINLNPALDPDDGGESWRLRDGVNAGAPGDVGDATLLQALSDAMSAQNVTASGNFGTGAYSASGLTATLASQAGSDRLFADQRLGFATTQLNELTQLELADGVDTDAELQRLMVIEQAYAANARMIEAVDEMMQTLMRL